MRFSPILLSLALCSALAAQWDPTFTELLLDPPGANRGRQVVELQNPLNRPVDLTGWALVAGTSTFALPSITLGSYQEARIWIGTSGVNSPSDLYLPALAELTASETLALYRAMPIGNPADLVDFVSWGGGTGQITQAVRAGQWPSSAESLVLPQTEGVTLAYYGDATFGNRNGPDGWYVDGTPTLGLPNDNASSFNVASGCPQTEPGWIGLARPQSRPWIGETWELDAYNLSETTTQVVYVLGARRIPPLSLAPWGLPDCFLLQSFELVIPSTATQGRALLRTTIPNDPLLVGQSFYTQALLIDPGAPNPGRGGMTNMIIATVGSR